MFRQKDNEFLDGNEAYPYLPDGFLVSGEEEFPELADWYSRWDRATAESFAPPEIPGRFNPLPATKRTLEPSNFHGPVGGSHERDHTWRRN